VYSINIVCVPSGAHGFMCRSRIRGGLFLGIRLRRFAVGVRDVIGIEMIRDALREHFKKVTRIIMQGMRTGPGDSPLRTWSMPKPRMLQDTDLCFRTACGRSSACRRTDAE
jgi:hypothetical protein